MDDIDYLQVYVFLFIIIHAALYQYTSDNILRLKIRRVIFMLIHIWNSYDSTHCKAYIATDIVVSMILHMVINISFQMVIQILVQIAYGKP